MESCDLLIYVEDPGAANFVISLPEMCKQNGIKCNIIGQGTALVYLKERGVNVFKVPTGASIGEILINYQPKLFLAGTAANPDSIALPMIAMAKTRGIQTIGLVDAAVNAEYRFKGRSSDPLFFAPDLLIIPDVWTKKQFIELGYPAEKSVVCGHPHYDYVRSAERELSLQGCGMLRNRLIPYAQGRTVIVFAAEPFGSFNLEETRVDEFALTGRGKYPHRNRIVIEEFLDALTEVRPKPYLILRLHPRNTEEDFSMYIKEFDMLSRGGSPLEVLYCADLVVGMTSMLLLEAMLLGKPVLSILTREVEKEWFYAIREGAIPSVMKRQDIKDFMDKHLKRRNTALKDKAIPQDLFPVDCTNRLMSFVKGLLSENQ